jgi:hypothetical protein
LVIGDVGDLGERKNGGEEKKTNGEHQALGGTKTGQHVNLLRSDGVTGSIHGYLLAVK